MSKVEQLKPLEQSLAQNSDWNAIDAEVRTSTLNKSIEEVAGDVLWTEIKNVQKSGCAARKKKNDTGSGSGSTSA
ncbi:hypothetical protein HDV00_012846 [Rhizophlyctis rosea]|nr:hypothetical protein HDV00_012846 [Rhizophlyctis rosea]